MVKVLDCDLEVSKFKLQTRYYIFFQAGERHEPSYPSSYVSSRVTAVLLQGGL